MQKESARSRQGQSTARANSATLRQHHTEVAEATLVGCLGLRACAYERGRAPVPGVVGAAPCVGKRAAGVSRPGLPSSRASASSRSRRTAALRTGVAGVPRCERRPGRSAVSLGASLRSARESDAPAALAASRGYGVPEAPHTNVLGSLSLARLLSLLGALGGRRQCPGLVRIGLARRASARGRAVGGRRRGRQR
jgi:hypothetical protein